MLRRAAYGAWSRRNASWALPFASMTFARASDALYQNGAATDGSSAFFATAGTDVLALEDLGDGAGALARFEKSATNTVLRNREIDDAAWTTFGAATITAGQGGPTGSDAERVEVAGGTNIRYQNLTPGAGWRAFSAWCRSTSGTVGHYLGLYDGGQTDAGTTSLGTTYQRIVGARNCGAGAGNLSVADSRVSGGTGVSAGARDVRVSLVQLEVGRYSTSPIITAGASASRVADSLTLASGSVPPELFTDRGQFAQFSPEWATGDLTSGETRWLLSIGAGGNNGIRAYHDGTDIVIQALQGGTVKASKTCSAITKNALVGAVGWDPAAGLVYVNGSAGSAGTAWSWSTDDIRVGGVYGSTLELDGRLGALGGW